ncbi:thioredoxin domain-containing protein [Sulfurimonas sp.]|nr:thioredoxin domain-containing protein [Sulfurimonas sp.]
MSNRLEKEDSPYLQQHKDNPVDWWPWCDEAFEKAEAENKAIFISIGYSSCHWCHVMEEKVFENEECATMLNENFIAIKIDREERPDIDKYYQEVYQLLNNRAGGWPTSIFSTPQNKPFFAGTYIAPESQEGSIEGMGFKELTSLISRKVLDNDADLFKNADEVQTFLGKISHPTEATVLKEDFRKNFMLQVKNNYQTKNGGFSLAPKFPHANTLNALMIIDKLYDDKSAKAMLLFTLDEMKKGGMYDLVDGGFCRYATDEKWLVPHFEKMLYDNALLCEVYTNAYITYKDDSYLQIAKECADFWINHMSEDGLFYSASDADTDGEEGTYFLYEYGEVYKLLEENGYVNIDTILFEMGISKEGSFEGKNIVRFENGEVPAYFSEVKILLQSLRKSREYPFYDKKIQVSWSSMMIKALFTLGQVDSKYTQQAQTSLDALMEVLYADGKLYHTTLIHKKAKVGAFLEDYAFLSQALVSAYKFTQDELYLIGAQRFVNTALEEFYKNGTWSFSSGELVTKSEIYDNTYTSEIAIMVDALLSLGVLLEDEKYTHFAFKTLEYNSYNLGRKPVLSPYLLTQTLRYLKGDRVIKTDVDNMKNNAIQLAKIAYPFIHYKQSDEDGYMICGDKSCFSQTQDLSAIDELVTNSF